MNELYEKIPEIIFDKESIPKCKKISLTIDEGLWNQFQDHCDYNGFKYSTRISILIMNELKKFK